MLTLVQQREWARRLVSFRRVEVSLLFSRARPRALPLRSRFRELGRGKKWLRSCGERLGGPVCIRASLELGRVFV